MTARICKVVPHDPCSTPTTCVREQCQCSAASCGLRHLRVVAAWEGYYSGGEESGLTSVGREVPQRGPRSRYLALRVDAPGASIEGHLVGVPDGVDVGEWSGPTDHLLLRVERCGGI